VAFNKEEKTDKVIVPYNNFNGLQYINVNAMMYIKNLRPDICPISTCELMMNGCTELSPRNI